MRDEQFATTHRLGQHDGERANRCAHHQRRHERHATEGRRRPVERAQQTTVEDDAKPAQEDAQQHEGRQQPQRLFQRRNTQRWRGAADQPHAQGARGRGTDDADVGAEGVAELFPRLLDDEEDRGQRRVEGGGKSGRGARRQQAAHVVAIELQHLGDRGRDRGAHVDGGALAAGNQPRRKAEHAAHELYRQDAAPAHGAQPLHRAFDLLHAAAGSLGGEAAGEHKGNQQP